MNHILNGRKIISIAVITVLDILLTGIILLIFALFHHVLPAVNTEAVVAAVSTPPPFQLVFEDSSTPVPDTRTPWQIKFEDKFSEEITVTENSYKSPEVSIEIETVCEGEGEDIVTYHVADIYIASPELFSTYTADNELRVFSTQAADEMVAASEAILAINGDFYCYQDAGLLIRNGQAFMTELVSCDICVMFEDGSIEMYSKGEYTNEELLARSPMQIWNFGPSLLDKNGRAREDYKNLNANIVTSNPRSALGYYEPGHYCFVVVDGRQEGYSEGMTMQQLSKLFEDLGCASAYNMDGGGSAVMYFNGKAFSRQSDGADRELGDILLIRERTRENETF